MLSPQYLLVHRWRHVMTHFIQTLQNYLAGDVLQTAWERLKKNVVNAVNIDQLYTLHIDYLKNILFM